MESKLLRDYKECCHNEEIVVRSAEIGITIQSSWDSMLYIYIYFTQRSERTAETAKQLE